MNYDLGIGSKDRNKLLAALAVLGLQGIKLGEPGGELKLDATSLHVNLETKLAYRGTQTGKDHGKNYFTNECKYKYPSGWFNLDDPHGAIALLSFQVDQVAKSGPKEWLLGSRKIKADRSLQAIVAGCTRIPLSTLKEMVTFLEGNKYGGIKPRTAGYYDFGIVPHSRETLSASLLMLHGAGYKWSDEQAIFSANGQPGDNSSVWINRLGTTHSSVVIHVQCSQYGSATKLIWVSPGKASECYPSGFFDLSGNVLAPISGLLTTVVSSKSWKLYDSNGRYSRYATADLNSGHVFVDDDGSRIVALQMLKEMVAALS